MSRPPELPSHIRRIVDEIETEIGEEPGHAESMIEGAGADGTDGEGGHDNGRVEDAVRQILLEISEEPGRQDLDGTPRRHRRTAAVSGLRRDGHTIPLLAVEYHVEGVH